MRKYILLIAVMASISGCIVKESPLSLSLTKIIDKIIKENPSCEVIQIQASEINGHNLLYISCLSTYNPFFMDGYTLYKGRLVSFIQTDSIDRSNIIHIESLHKPQNNIDNFKNAYSSHLFSEPTCTLFEVKDNQIVEFRNYSVLFDTTLCSEQVNCNIVANKQLLEFMVSSIRNRPSVLYELRFWQQNKRQYVFWRPMPIYDKNKFDGYFYIGRHLIVLYGTKYAGNLLNNGWTNNSQTIPQLRCKTIYDWNFPIPLKLETLSNGHIRTVHIEQSFFIRDSL